MESSVRKKPRSPWPFAIVVFFIVIAAVNGIMLTLAIRGYGGLLDENPYEAGVGYQDEIDALQAFKDAGWKAHVESSPLRVTLRTGDGEPITGALIRFHALRPNDAAQDVNVQLREESPGVYVSGDTLKPGTWLTRIAVVWRGRRYQINGTQ